METTTIALPDFSKMSISEIATHIYADMRATGFRKKPSFEYCSQQLDAMTYIQTVDDKFIAETGRDFIPSFLYNAQTWKGVTAKAIKAELNKRLKQR